MFTGLVEAMGTIGEAKAKGDSELVELTIESRQIAPSLKLGDSVAVAGVCLTATHVEPLRSVV